ncbi:MAG: GGDEF domain-containing protein [Atribacterota bacterium]|nr:GGDEF domain-containing protein [Atribacterota bacterium]
MGKSNIMKKQKIFSFFYIPLALVILLLFSYLSVSSSNLNKDSASTDNTLIFLGNKNIAPIIFEEKGVAKGVVVDIVRELGKKIDSKIQVEAIEWEEAQKKVLAGDADALLQINPNPGRELLYDFSYELLKSEFSIFIKNGNTNINTVYDLKNKKTGVESGGYPYQLLSNYEGINIVIIPDWKAGFYMLQSGGIDAIVVDRWIGEYELARSRVDGIQIIECPIEISYSRIAVKKGNSELLNLINSGLKAMNDDGTMADILSNWRGKRVVYFTEEYVNRTIFYFFITILAVILLFTILVINRVKRLNTKLEQEVKKRTRELNDTNKKLQKANEQLKKFSMVDGLTNIPNRRYFDRALQKTWNISKREKMPLALIMLDIDYFKNYNDTYGHLAGDQSLIKVANVIKNNLKRPGDFVARFGGEEFVVLLFNTTEDGALAIAENLRSGVESLDIKNEGSIQKVITISLGISVTIPGNILNPENLIEAADQAMYQAKKEGRNRVVVSSLIRNKK